MKQITLIAAMLLAMTLMAPVNAGAEEFGQWITEEEASQKNREIPELQEGKSKRCRPPTFCVATSKSGGPVILVDKPAQNELFKKLIDIEVRFERNPMGEPVDMKSLKIMYLKWIDINITDRILPYVKRNQILASKIKFPEGSHKFEIIIRDKDDMESSIIIAITVE